MSHTDKTDPHWVKLSREKIRDEWHSSRCTGDNCDIETSVAPWNSRGRPGTRVEVRTQTRIVQVPNPDYNPMITDWYDDNSWRRFMEVERNWTYRVKIYDGTNCYYNFTQGVQNATNVYGSCSCCGLDEFGIRHSRAEDRAVLTNLRAYYNAGVDLDSLDYVFDNDARWGKKW
jgi:hypothetical protein